MRADRSQSTLILVLKKKRFILKKIITIFILAQGLIGCSLMSSTGEFASNNKTEYLHSRNSQGLLISKPLSDANISDFYQLSNQTTQVTGISIKPPVIRTSE